MAKTLESEKRKNVCQCLKLDLAGSHYPAYEVHHGVREKSGGQPSRWYEFWEYGQFEQENKKTRVRSRANVFQK